MKKYKNISSKYLTRKNELVVILFTLMHFLSPGLFSQSQLLTYKVIRNGAEAGWVKINRNMNGAASVISMASEIKVKVIFLITVFSNEYAEFNSGKLVHAYVFRKINGNIKTDTHTRLKNDSYEAENFSHKQKMNITPVGYNVLDLYFHEPDSNKEAYSGFYQRNLRVENKQPHIYTLTLPDGSMNEYHYNENGLCTKVKINQTLYSAEFHLVQN